MGSNLRRKVSEYIKTYIYRSRWHKAVTVLAGIVVFCTAYALILPAITMTRETTCGLEEHEHTEACYTVVPAQAEMLCSAESLGIHQHTADCKNADGQLVCGYADFVVHTHDDLCYSEDGTLICTLDEIAEHEHDEDCYKTEKTLICGQEESGHEHTDACYTRVKGDLTCELPETEGHTHSEECYETAENGDGSVTATSANATEKVLVCGKDEEEPHTHTDDCYEWTEELTCGKEEAEGHIHTDECYEEKEVLDCDEKEVVLHTHDESCYDENGALTCGQVEVKEHQHTAECVQIPDGEVKKLTCGQQEHKHTEECYAVEENYICGLEEHEHTEECYAADGTLICGLEEHKHTEECLAPEFMLMAALPGTYVNGGKITGTELSWAVTEDDAGNRTLTISGEGDMPDYENVNLTPWYNYLNSKTTKLVVAEGVTRVGNTSFAGNWFTECDLANTIGSLGASAFKDSKQLTDITIPGSVETIGESCFYGNRYLQTVTLEEGVKEIGKHAFFWLPANSALPKFHLPASLTFIGDECFTTVEEFTVEPGNENFSTVDGVLFNGDQTRLLIYPKNREAAEYVVPNTVTSIAAYALRRVLHTDKLVINHQPVKFEDGNAYFAYSNYQEIEIADGVILGNSGIFFRECYQLRTLKLPANMSYVDNPIDSCTSLEEFTIPAGVTNLNSLLLPASLQKLTYNAKDITRWGDNLNIGNSAYMELVIGRDVDKIDWVTENAAKMADIMSLTHTIRFEGENTFTVAEGSFAQAPSPISRISGSVYVDEKGVVYTYDKDAGTAKLVYCPPEVEKLTIPATISPEAGVSCTVNTVGQDAMKFAENLKSVTIENPGNITELESYAFANCPLERVNEKTTYREVLELFTQIDEEDMGYNAFYNTKLQGAPGSGTFEEDMDGKKSLTVTKDGSTDLNLSFRYNEDEDNIEKNWVPNKEDSETGGYHMLTGQTIKITAGAGHTIKGEKSVYRVYIQRTDETASLGIKPGESESFDNLTVKYYATEDPNTFYAEFSVPEELGGTVSIEITANYPSPGTSGGGVTAWGVILTDENEAKANEEKLLLSDTGTLQAYWGTEQEKFSVTKKSIPDPERLGITGDGYGRAKPASDLNWEINVTHEATDKTSVMYGKDYATSVDYTDAIRFEQGVNWNEMVRDAIKGGDVRQTGNDIYAIVDGKEIRVASISTGGGSLIWDEGLGMPALKWSQINSSQTTEFSPAKVNLTIYADALSVDMTKFSDTKYYETITNEVNAQVHFHYGNDQTPEKATAVKTISGGQGSLSLRKTGTSATYFGEEIIYTLELENTGAVNWNGEQGVYVIRDNLNQEVPSLYLSPANMQKMFEDEETGNQLTVIVSNALLGEWIPVTGVDGTQTWQYPGNSDMKDVKECEELSITKDGTSYKVSIKDGGEFSGESVLDVLQKAGCGVTEKTKFACEWTLNQENEKLVIKGGEHRQFTIYAAARDSFRAISKDWPHSYPSNEAVKIRNQAHMMGPDNKPVVSSEELISTSVKREAEIAKSVSKDGTLLGSEPTAADKDVLDYHLEFTHYGKGEYRDLPMVDDLYGSQLLMVPAELNGHKLNEHLENIGLKTHTETAEDGTETVYYLLDDKVQGGKYENVVVGVDDEKKNLTAASITVTSATSEDVTVHGGEDYSETHKYSGLHTQIKWYFPYLEGGNYRKTVDYKALVDVELSGAEYAIGNIVWMNDRTGDRIFASLWGRGSIIDFDKKIVIQRGDNPKDDILDEDDYSIINQGDQVTYRLRLENHGTGDYTLSGLNLADALPDTYKVFDWVKGENGENGNVEIVGVRREGEAEFIGKDDWYIGNDYGGLIKGRQYILWPKESSIKFHNNSAVYIYVQLTFPTNVDEGKGTWSDYAKANRGGILDNTMYVYRFPSNVLHELAEEGRVFLQKGVYGFARRTSENSMEYQETGSDRQFYNNRDSRWRSVTYYVTLYNGGNKRLYLNDLYDRLPKGFTYKQMTTNGSYRAGTIDATSITTIGGQSLGANPLVEMSDDVSYRSALVGATPSEDRRSVRFSIRKGNGTDSVKYDEKRKQCYLDRGEAIVFGYIADIGVREETEDEAINTIGMLYTDHLNTKFEMISKQEYGLHAPTTDRYKDRNDGSRKHGMKTTDEVKETYGIDGPAGDWLESTVSVWPGGIVPGITKSTKYRQVGEDGAILDYADSVGYSDAVYWRVEITNTGTVSMTDFTFTDIMPSPYLFEGKVSFKIYEKDKEGKDSLILGNKDSTEKGREGERDLLQFPRRETGSESVLVSKLYGGGSETVKHDGEFHAIKEPYVGTDVIFFALEKNSQGEEVLKLHFQDPKYSIPEGGTMQITFTSRNRSNDYENMVYVNDAYLTPSQPFTYAGQGTKVDFEEKPSVYHASPVTVSFGTATKSEKRVVEVDDVTNNGHSTDPKNNTILLPSTTSEFRYTLTVENSTEDAMTQLVIIDNLPDVNDHYPFDTGDNKSQRGSAFTVEFAANPEIEGIVLYPNGGGSRVLKRGSELEIDYSLTTDFGGAQSGDWHAEEGDEEAVWNAVGPNRDDEMKQIPETELKVEGARAIRFIISNEREDLITPGAKVEISFTAQIKTDGDNKVEPGAIAWNNFGYDYHLSGMTKEAYLESMPLVVGIKVPEIPTLKKYLVDGNEQPIKAAKDETFRFLVYQGEALEKTYETKGELEAALKEAGKKYREYELKVLEGQSESEETPLLDSATLKWEKDKQYTVVEIPREGFQLMGFNRGESKSYTFTYDPAKSEAITCRNQDLRWSIKLIKKAGENEQRVLSGAVFGLYGPKNEEFTIPDEYGDLDIQTSLTENEKTWHLIGIKESDSNGEVIWGDLFEQQYYLMELKAPDGYNPIDGWTVDRTQTESGVYNNEVINYTGAELPQTGGTGTLPLTAGGLALLALAGLMYEYKRLRKEDKEEKNS